MAEFKVLMVCLGNICRSPMADGLLRKKVEEAKLNVVVDSAGTGDWHVGEAPDERMRKTAQKNGTPIDFLRARQFMASDFKTFDMIYVMDRSNYDNVIRLAENEAEKEKVDFILHEIQPGTQVEVPDPYFGGEQGFKDVYNMLDEATSNIIIKLKKQFN